MSKKVLISLFIIALTIAGVTGATAAYFSSNAVLGANTFTTGTVKLGEGSIIGDPINLTGITPDKTVSSKIIGIKYNGSIPADLYVGMKANGGTDFRNVLDFYIEEVKGNGDHIRNVTSWSDIGNLFGTWTKVYDSINANETKYYKVYVTMDKNAGNDFQDKTTSDDILIYAVQHGFGTPDKAPFEYVIN